MDYVRGFAAGKVFWAIRYMRAQDSNYLLFLFLFFIFFEARHRGHDNCFIVSTKALHCSVRGYCMRKLGVSQLKFVV